MERAAGGKTEESGNAMNESPQVLRYTGYGPVEERTETAPTPSHPASTIFSWGILVLCLGVWAGVGALFWIPLLLRRILTYSLALVAAMLAGKKPEAAAQTLRDAMSFYWRGFTVTAEMIAGQPGPAERADRGAENEGLSGLAMVTELTWALLVWYVVLLATGVVEITPLDLWRSLAGIPWWEKVIQPAVEWGRSIRP